MAEILVGRRTLDRINADIAHNHQLMMYRPTAVAIVEDERGKILLVKSAKGPYWGFPQGGVEAHEGVIQALLRELYEEVFITPHFVEVRMYCVTERVDIPSGASRDGFSHGKQYYYFHVGYRGPSALVVQHSEVSDYQWRSRLAVSKFIHGFDEQYRRKKLSMLIALSMLPSPNAIVNQ